VDEQKPVVDLSGSQIGEVRSRDAAGRDIYHGIDLDSLGRFVEGARHSSDAMVAALERLGRDLGTLRTETQYYQELEAARWKVQARSNAVLRRWLAALTLVLALFAVVIVGLVWREMASLAARAVFDIAGLVARAAFDVALARKLP
jgi:hypothetical protein